MKKLLSLFVIVAILFSITGCNASAVKEGMSGGSTILEGISDIVGSGTDKSDVVLEDYGSVDSDDFADGGFSVDGEFISDEPCEGMVEDTAEGSSQNAVVAGILTAGEWKDSEDQEFWTKLLNRNDWYQYMEDRNLYPVNIVTVNVLDEELPCYNVTVMLLGEDGQTLYEARTDVNGKAYLLYDLNNSKEKALYVKIGEKTVEVTDEKVINVVAKDAGVKVKALDLMLMVDTTGSMSDELIYLQKELEDVIKRVSKADEALSINVSVNFYRDETDEYVVRAFDFTNDIETALKQLKKQKSDGGGDYPEAVHTALNSIVNEHRWRDDAVKLCFMVLDAPPHDENDIKGINAELQSYVQAAASKGIRIIPVASSGVNTETEFLLRSYALMTGGTYVFLTDHSGVGGEHLEPTIGEYEVEALNELMIRVVLEYCGLNYTKSPEQK